MERKVYVFSSLGMAPTDNCNYRCLHCSTGSTIKNIMTTPIIERTLENIYGMNQLYFIGGEPLMALKQISEIIEYIIKKEIIVLQSGLTTNGTFYTDEIEYIFDYFDEYIRRCRNKTMQNEIELVSHIRLSWDLFHIAELNKIRQRSEKLFSLYCQRIQNLMDNSKRLIVFEYMKGPIFNEGRAKKLNTTKQEYLPFDMFSWTDEKRKISISKNSNDILTYVGPDISVFADGTVTDCNASYKRSHQDLKRGNILEESLLTIIDREAISCSSFNEFNSKQKNELKKVMKIN